MRRATAFLAVLALAGCGGDEDERQLGTSIDYAHSTGGVVGARLTAHVELDGRVSAEGAGTITSCPRGPGSARLPVAQLGRLKAALEDADLADVKSEVTPQVEAPELRIESGEVTYRHVGFTALPKRVEPLVRELELAAAYACRVRR